LLAAQKTFQKRPTGRHAPEHRGCYAEPEHNLREPQLVQRVSCISDILVIKCRHAHHAFRCGLCAACQPVRLRQGLGSTAGAGTTALPCPTAKPAIVATFAPTPQEFTALINSLVSSYGTRLGPSKNVVDAAVGRESNTSGIAGALFMRGAASASVYTSALAVLRKKEILR
jgi:hypothetical protein